MAKKEYFGEESKGKSTVKTAKRATKAPITKPSTRRARKTTATKIPRGYVTIQVPAALAFQIGVELGQSLNR